MSFYLSNDITHIGFDMSGAINCNCKHHEYYQVSQYLTQPFTIILLCKQQTLVVICSTLHGKHQGEEQHSKGSGGLIYMMNRYKT